MSKKKQSLVLLAAIVTANVAAPATAQAAPFTLPIAPGDMRSDSAISKLLKPEGFEPMALARSCSDPWYTMSGIQLATCLLSGRLK
ncbi:MAG: hypothetical protein WBA76_20170 [Phormidesmis sp.]